MFEKMLRNEKKSSLIISNAKVRDRPKNVDCLNETKNINFVRGKAKNHNVKYKSNSHLFCSMMHCEFTLFDSLQT